jgi:hypothetical protein
LQVQNNNGQYSSRGGGGTGTYLFPLCVGQALVCTYMLVGTGSLQNGLLQNMIDWISNVQNSI